MKFLSLCIPTYNRPHTLRTIFTVLSACSEKTKRKVEVVIADNSTNDETTKLCGSYSRTIDIRYHKNRKNIGAHKNLQRVTSLAAGEYVWLFGDDDTFSVHTFENVLKRLERHLPDVYLVDRMLYHEDGRTVYEKPYQSYFPNGFNGTMQELLTVLSPLFAFGCISCNIFRRKNARLREFARYRTFRCSHSHVGFIVANFWNGQKVLVDVKNSIQTVVTQRESGYEHVAADESIDTSELLKRITDIAVHDPETIINIQAKAGLDRREARRQLLFHQRVEKRKKSGVVNDSFASVGTGNLPPIVKESETMDRQPMPCLDAISREWFRASSSAVLTSSTGSRPLCVTPFYLK
ncbi:MAG: glycosyltransferase [Planctomycetes bacterium]|nr:glycosyltransferase [Planctomycetota bacterium]